MNALLRVAALPCSLVSAHLLWLPSRDGGAEAQSTDRQHLPPSASCPGSPLASWQSDTESIASPAVALKMDLEAVEAQLRALTERRARVEAELLHFTCEETHLRKQQPRFLHCIFAAKHVENAEEDPAPERNRTGLLLRSRPSLCPLRFLFPLRVCATSTPLWVPVSCTRFLFPVRALT